MTRSFETGLGPRCASSHADRVAGLFSAGSFAPAPAADFEALVDKLEARDSDDLPAEVGKRRMDISQPGFKIAPPLPAGTVLELEGALRLSESPAAEWPPENSTRFQAELKKILDAPWRAMKDGGQRPAGRAADLRLLASGATRRGD